MPARIIVAVAFLTFATFPCLCPAADAAATGPATRPRKPLVQGFAAERVREKMNRGLIARPVASNRVYLGWRLLDSDPAGVGFNVYRRGDAANARPLNDKPITATTDFIDANPPAAPAEYYVRPVANGREGALSEAASTGPATTRPTPYTSIKLDGNHTCQKIAIADLDGDGRYDYVIKQPKGNVDPYKQYWNRSPDTCKLEAYDHDGKFLWRHDMGWSIEMGIWYSPYVVADLDGDGRAEVALKAGEGDPRDADGHVTSGPEHLLILDGLTGKTRARIDWPSRGGFEDYNRYSRNQLAVAYLDGKTPALIVQRGTYSLIKMTAYEFRGDKLRELWRWDSDEEKAQGKSYRGQGAHCLRAADVDGDGRDEVVLGSAVIDDNGQTLWCTKLGHPDHVYIGDLDPTRPGLEIYYGMETRQTKFGVCMVDATTGKILWGFATPTRHVHGQGLCADIDPAHPGVECYSADTDTEKKLERPFLHTAQGKLLDTKDLGGFAPNCAYWDADVQREMVTRGRIHKYNGPELEKIAGSVIGVADVHGDWREEIFVTVPGELRIHTTTIPATDRRKCLMLDPMYRSDVTGFSQGYFQVPSLLVLPGTEKP